MKTEYANQIIMIFHHRTIKTKYDINGDLFLKNRRK